MEIWHRPPGLSSAFGASESPPDLGAQRKDAGCHKSISNSCSRRMLCYVLTLRRAWLPTEIFALP
eukprot:10827841-Karenia_brevis.AAC.1